MKKTMQSGPERGKRLWSYTDLALVMLNVDDDWSVGDSENKFQCVI